MLEWNPEPNCNESCSIEEQIFSYMMEAVFETIKACNIEKINLAGYCQGGTYALIALYFYPEVFRRAVFYNIPIDFTTAGLFEPTKALPKFFIDILPTDTIPFQITDIPTYSGDILMGDILPGMPLMKSYKWFRAVNKWENDAVPMPKNIFSQWIKLFYQENRLSNNNLTFGGTKIILEDIKTPILSIVAEVDDIAPKEMAAPIKNRLPNGKELCVRGGHLSTTAGHFAIKHSWPATVSWFRDDKLLSNIG
ncbi:hypothetical protein [Natranaerofaba carboxydovora]|uniref:hypothetical protein n=1 Tax=Natranaerofaba carboxydovora TaxID=2742683 RepID=UPI001F1421C4|nr:hypothetical protein [Natranaerofaba carboxydovora]